MFHFQSKKALSLLRPVYCYDRIHRGQLGGVYRGSHREALDSRPRVRNILKNTSYTDPYENAPITTSRDKQSTRLLLGSLQNDVLLSKQENIIPALTCILLR